MVQFDQQHRRSEGQNENGAPLRCAGLQILLKCCTISGEVAFGANSRVTWAFHISFLQRSMQKTLP